MEKEKLEPDLSGITLNDEPLVVEELDTTNDSETDEARKEEQRKHYKYRRPIVKKTDRKQKSSEPRTLSMRERNMEYGDKLIRAEHSNGSSVGRVMLQKMLSTQFPETFNQHIVELTEILGKAPWAKSSWSSVYSSAWKKSPIFYLVDIIARSKRPTRYGLLTALKDYSVEELAFMAMPSGWKKLQPWLCDNPQFVKYFPEGELHKHNIVVHAAECEEEKVEQEQPDIDLPPVESYTAEDDFTYEDLTGKLEGGMPCVEDCISALKIYADSIGMRVVIKFENR